MKSNRQNAGVLILLFAGVLMGALDISVVGPAIPSIEETLGVGTREISWIFNSYLLFNLVGISLFTKLSDRYGRRNIYIIALSFFAAGSLIVALADHFYLLVAGRAIQGLGSSGIFPVAAAAIGDLFPVEKRGRALGLLGAAFGVAFLAGPFIAGTILLYFKWNSLFFINVPVAILLAVLSMRLLPSKKPEGRFRFDYPGIILMGLILALLTIALASLDASRIAESLFSSRVLPLFAFALILTVILFLVEKNEKNPVVEVRFFRSKEIRLVGILATGLGIFQSVILFLPTLAVNQFDATPSIASFMLIPLVLLSAVGSPLNGRLVDLIGSRVIITAGLVFAAAGLFLLSRTFTGTALFFLAAGLLGFGLSLRVALNYIMLNETGELQRATAQGMLLIFITLGQITGASFISVMAASSGGILTGFRNAFLILSGLAAVLAVLSFFLKNRNKELRDFIPKQEQSK